MIEKDKRILINIIKVFGVKGGAVIVNLLTVPAYIHYFSDEGVLGIWYTIISILSWILAFDLGIGNGLRNKLSIALTKGNYSLAKEYITSAYIVISGLMIVVGGSFIFALRYINWNKFFNISTKVIKNEVLYHVVSTVILSLLLQFILNIIKSILYAIQEASVPSFLVLCTSMINFLYAKLAPVYSIEINLKRFSFVYLISANLPLLICTFWIFGRKLRKCRPNLKYFVWKRTADILGVGGQFFFVQIMYLLIMNTNEFIITRISGPDKVVDYQIYYKIFSSIGMGVSLALTPIWSAITEAMAQNDYQWIQKIVKRMIKAGLLVAGGIITILPFFPFLLKVWLGNNQFNVNIKFLILFAILSICIVFNGILSNIANGLGELKTQVISFTIGAIIHIVGGIYLTNFMHSWIGMVIGTILALLPYLIMQPVVLKKMIDKKV